MVRGGSSPLGRTVESPASRGFFHARRLRRFAAPDRRRLTKNCDSTGRSDAHRWTATKEGQHRTTRATETAGCACSRYRARYG